MAYQVSPRVPVSLIVLLLSSALAGYGLLRSHHESTESELLAFVGVMSAISLTQIGVIMGDSVVQPEQQLFWANFVNAIAVLLIVYALLWFTLAYSENDQWITRKTVGVALGHIVLSGVVVAVAPEIMYEVTGQSTSGPTTVLGITFEEWVFIDRTPKLPFVLLQLYSYTAGLVSAFVLARYIVRNRTQLYVGQIATLCIGVGTPIILNSLVLIGAVSLSVNYTTMSLGVTSVAFGIAVFRYRLFRLAPIGRRQLIDTMDDPVLVIDTENRVVDSNRTARFLAGSPDDWRGTSLTKFSKAFSSEVTSVEEFQNEQILCTQNDEKRWFDPRISPIQSERGSVAGHIVLLREITELNEQKERVTEQNEQLEQFTEVVSHDLRNPLTVASNSLELAQEESDSPYLDNAVDAIDRSQVLVEDLLAFAQTDETSLQSESIILSELIEECWEGVPSENATLIVETKRTISADRSRLKQLFENLFRNSVEHGGGDVTITVGALSDGFYVADDGAGLSAGDHREIFETKYSTADGGLGIGLQIVQRTVDAHDWEIAATDSQDGGARFEVTGVETT